jgi:transcriptional regulator with XRE-family HTH domain
MMLGEFVRNHRKEEGLTLEKLAKLVGTSKSHIFEIEKGKTMPSLVIAARIAQALDVSLQQMGRAAINSDIAAKEAGK